LSMGGSKFTERGRSSIDKGHAVPL
jgi:hypothetical protein